MKTVRLGSGAGYSGDRIDPAVELARFGHLNYLIFECLAERTIALAQHSKKLGLSEGYDPLLEERMVAVLPYCAIGRVRIISNMGAANPLAAARKTVEIARQLGIRGLKIAAIEGDEVLDLLPNGCTFLETGNGMDGIQGSIISANAYLGAGALVDALMMGADIILTGRVADPALFLAPLIFEFRWSPNDWNLMGQGTVIGHLMECAGQLTGGYFSDPGYKDVKNLATLGFPIAEVSEDGSAVLSKVDGSGGLLSRATCLEQLLYEIQDPTAYVTPDVIANFSQVNLEEVGPDLVKVSGGLGVDKPDSLKVSVGHYDGYVGEGQISYAGAGALGRAQLAESILKQRLSATIFQDLRFDLIGVNAIHGSVLSSPHCDPYEVRLRVACRAKTMAQAAIVPREVEALYTNGPAGGGGVTTSLKQTVAILSTFIPATAVQPRITFEVS